LKGIIVTPREVKLVVAVIAIFVGLAACRKRPPGPDTGTTVGPLVGEPEVLKADPMNQKFQKMLQASGDFPADKHTAARPLQRTLAMKFEGIKAIGAVKCYGDPTAAGAKAGLNRQALRGCSQDLAYDNPSLIRSFDKLAMAPDTEFQRWTGLRGHSAPRSEQGMTVTSWFFVLPQTQDQFKDRPSKQ
jgi:hypothetical protein